MDTSNTDERVAVDDGNPDIWLTYKKIAPKLKRPGRRDMMLTKREVRDLWRAAAKAHRAAGRIAEAKRCTETAKLWS